MIGQIVQQLQYISIFQSKYIVSLFYEQVAKWIVNSIDYEHEIGRKNKKDFEKRI